MYYPYFRGKQFELLALRESAEVLAEASFVPIIEPVRESLNGLERALAAIGDAGGRAIVIVNPRHGDHKDDGANISAFLSDNYRGNDAISAGVLLLSTTSFDEAEALISSHAQHSPAIVHSGFTAARDVAEFLRDREIEATNVFSEAHASMLYRKHFGSGNRVLVRDGFEQKKNADYEPSAFFSDLHVTFEDLNMQGYGDFLTVGDRYTEGGGPAYAVAIHLTYIDPTQDNAMYVYHFKSDSNDTPTDPANKFAEALAKLIAKLDSVDSKLLATSATEEFRRLYEAGHFPGLGYIKKLSIRHHIETLADYHRNVDG
ncbi:ATP-binding protein [Leifsonia sp. Root227]|uniref:sce7725 family protein n=1 Tax=Leifsonia sp. Root227 TaxID=1736496 RepID=UPI0006F49603|nr:sce7725 family protein [Leifsonia sp. Root227]KRC52351.1 ATP-binding protein [Leifsonia sp. Root227]